MRPENERRVLIVAPIGRDAALICGMLQRRNMPCSAFATVGDALHDFENGAGALLIAEEAMSPAALQALSHAFEAQPRWSSIPVVLLTRGQKVQASAWALQKRMGSPGRLIIVERPTRPLTLHSAVDAALAIRLRQYEVRDYLEERLRNEERLRQTQKLESIGILAGGIAHDFNNLLTGILGNASLAVDELPEDHAAQPLLRDVISAAESAAHLTRQLLAYAGKGNLVSRPIQLSDLIAELTRFIQTSIPKSVDFSLELAAGLPMLEGDPGQIQQLAMNLIINGSEAIPESARGVLMVATGSRTVSASAAEMTFQHEPIAPGDYVTLEVRDTGAGMDGETLEKIFDPFFTTKFTGRGLGLAAALGIVRAHKGALQVSSAPGVGTTFTVLFPVIENPVEAEEGPTGEISRGRGKGTVLVVEDEAVVQRVAANALRNKGYHVLIANNGREALEIFGENPAKIDAVVLDLTMPVMGGEETLRQLRAMRPDVNVVLSSGHSEAEALARFGDDGESHYLQKPYKAAQLVDEVSGILGRSERLR